MQYNKFEPPDFCGNMLSHHPWPAFFLLAKYS